MILGRRLPITRLPKEIRDDVECETARGTQGLL
jgi:hypothetical protein